MRTSNIHIVDTNFILRYLLADIPEQYQITTKFFQQVIDNKIKAIIRETVLTEVVFVLSSHYKVSRDRIVQALSGFLRYKSIVIESKEIILEALNIYQHSNLHIVDSIIAAHAKAGSYTLTTFDKELKQYLNSEST
jgi:predicted nucleic-acid-binding protein